MANIPCKRVERVYGVEWRVYDSSYSHTNVYQHEIEPCDILNIGRAWLGLWSHPGYYWVLSRNCSDIMRTKNKRDAFKAAKNYLLDLVERELNK